MHSLNDAIRFVINGYQEHYCTYMVNYEKDQLGAQ